MLDPNILREAFKRKRYGGGNDYDPDFDMFDAAADEIDRLRAALAACVEYWRDCDVPCPPALHDTVTNALHQQTGNKS